MVENPVPDDSITVMITNASSPAPEIADGKPSVSGTPFYTTITVIPLPATVLPIGPPLVLPPISVH
jgi:hypothetical protein